MPRNFYVTTPIYYPSGRLHIGHAYTTTLADILKRYKKRSGYQVFFLTGSDEHGQKIAKKASEVGLQPLDYLAEKVAHFKNLWEKLHIDYDKFIRTTDSQHQETVQKIFSQLLAQGLIYKGNYEGLYCVSCEEFLTAEQIDEQGYCKVSQTVPEKISEPTYFLKISAYQQFVEKLLHREFLLPAYRRPEMLKNFVEPGLKDLSVTRVSFAWGIPVREAPEHVIYVWLDALTNYISALGYLQNESENFQQFWGPESEIVQIVGKEIIRFHAIYWPIILETLGLRQPNKLLAHGWILNKETKMSKSLGNVIDPLVLIDQFGADALRFYLAHELPTDRDGNFSLELFKKAYNTQLANNLGNLISRLTMMIQKYADGLLPDLENIDDELKRLGQQSLLSYQKLMDAYQISDAITTVLNLSTALNKYLEDQEPWKLAKEGKKTELFRVLATVQRLLIMIVFLLEPILVEKSPLMYAQLGVKAPQKLTFEMLKTFQGLEIVSLPERQVIYPRFND